MTGGSATSGIERPRLAVSARGQILAFGLALAGMAAALAALVHDPVRAWSHLLLDTFYLLSMSLAALLFVAIQLLSAARWSACLRRIPEALMATLPVAAVLMLSLTLLRGVIGPARHAETIPSPSKALYLSTPFMTARAAVVLGAWVGLAALVRRASLRQDADGGFVHHAGMKRYSAIGVVVFAITFSIAAVDWLMSLDPRWVSTIFACYLFAGLFVQGIAAVTLVAALLRVTGRAAFITEDHLHDLGRLLFGFSTFWAYIWFSQYLLIWYSNIPDEVTHYATRTSGAWLPLFWANLAVNWAVPFAVLPPRATKRDARVLIVIAIAVLAGRWLDLYLVILPETTARPQLGWAEMATALGAAGLLAGFTMRALGDAPLVPGNDPFLEASLGHHTT
jgi:hypothetical protein